MNSDVTQRRPDWVFSVSFALTMAGFLAWIVWYTLTRTSAGFP
jgi:predicted membrane metal-binding protein